MNRNRDPHRIAEQGVLNIACPACNAQPGKTCTWPTDTGRKPVPWVHYARQTAFKDAVWATEQAVRDADG